MSDQDVQAAVKELRRHLGDGRYMFRPKQLAALRLVLDALEARPTKEEAARLIHRMVEGYSHDVILAELDILLAERGARKA
jgi:hypothetical protein